MTELRDDLRQKLAGVADVLIPATDSMPSASEAHVHETGIDRVLDERPDLLDRLSFLEHCGDDPKAVVYSLKAEDPDTFAGLFEAVAGAYFLDPGVTEKVGYRRREGIPTIEFDTDLDQLTAPVVTRGRAYRPAPE